MAEAVERGPIWDDIERSESYLVCSMFEEAASLASSVIQNVCDNIHINEIEEDIEVNNMLESSGMVLVQSLQELGRTLEILQELKQLYGSVIAIPVQVLLIGVCFQMQDDPSVVQEFLEEFLCKWRCVDDRYYVLSSADKNFVYIEGCNSRFVLGVDIYFQVVEVYVVTLLTVVLHKMDFAIFWIEKAALPEYQRQELLRQVHSICSSTVTSSPEVSTSVLLEDELGTSSTSLKELNSYEGLSKNLETAKLRSGEGSTKETILKFSGQKVSCFWLFPTINLKFGKTRLVISNGSVLVAILVLLTYYFMRKKKNMIKRILKGQVLLVKKALVDLWQLAFSYQVNPLAAIDPHSVTLGNR